jgi:hypothetical protein
MGSAHTGDDGRVRPERSRCPGRGRLDERANRGAHRPLGAHDWFVAEALVRPGGHGRSRSVGCTRPVAADLGAKAIAGLCDGDEPVRRSAGVGVRPSMALLLGESEVRDRRGDRGSLSLPHGYHRRGAAAGCVREQQPSALRAALMAACSQSTEPCLRAANLQGPFDPAVKPSEGVTQRERDVPRRGQRGYARLTTSTLVSQRLHGAVPSAGGSADLWVSIVR